MFLVKAGLLIDGNGGKPERGMAVLVNDEGRIETVGPREQLGAPTDVPVVDAGSAVVMPGMIDAHLHLVGDGDPEGTDYNMRNVVSFLGQAALDSYIHAKEDLFSGFTTLRDMGSRGFVDVALRDTINAGRLVGPRLFVSGQGLTSTGGHMDPEKRVIPGVTVPDRFNVIDGPTEARRATRYLISKDVDVIKIAATLSEWVRRLGLLCAPEMTLETMQAICEVAHSAGRRVAAHCHGGPGVTAAIEAGVDTFEHGRFMTDEMLEQLAEKERYLVPTLSPEGRADDAEQSTFGKAAHDVEWKRRATEAMYDTVNRAKRAGVKIGAGSDASMPLVTHGSGAYELELLVRAGLSNMEALVAVTRTNAEILGQEASLGTLEKGKFADMVFVAEDPSEDVKVLQVPENIQLVMKAGEVVVDRR